MNNTDEMVPAMALALTASFGSVAHWREAFDALSHQHAAGTLSLRYGVAQGRLLNLHDAADGVPLLMLDLADRQVLTQPLDWAAIYERYQRAIHDASADCAADPAQLELGDALLLDVRRDAMFAQATTMLPGASWRDPATVGDWSATLPRGREVVVYCNYGHEVGRATALRLRAAGVAARYLPGGIVDWDAAGRPVQSKTP